MSAVPDVSWIRSVAFFFENLTNLFGDFEDSPRSSAVDLARNTTRSTEEAMTQTLGEVLSNAARRYGTAVPETSTGKTMRPGLIAIDHRMHKVHVCRQPEPGRDATCTSSPGRIPAVGLKS